LSAAGGDTSSTYTYGTPGQPQPHTLRSVTTTGPAGTSTDGGFGYDPVGNTISRRGPTGAQTLGWDSEGRLASVTAGSTTSSYLYDADGTQLIRHDPSGATLYLPDGVEVHAGGAGTSSSRYYSVGGICVAVRTGAGVTFLGSDNHATPIRAVNADTGAVVTRRTDPFGNARGTAAEIPGSRGFVGGVVDPTAGLTQLGVRDYDAATGRFLSVDPALDTADPQQLNGYAYADENPVTNSDPTGQLCNNGPDGSCHKDDGTTVPTPGNSDHGFGDKTGGKGGPPAEDDGGVTFSHGDVTTTITSKHSYIQGIELPDSAPQSAKLADYVNGKIQTYKKRYQAAFHSPLADVSPELVLSFLLDCPFCDGQFKQWARMAHAVLTNPTSQVHLGKDGHTLLAMLGGSMFQPGSLHLRIGSTDLEEVDDDTPIYRGLHAGHYRMSEAEEGIAMPGDPDGHADPDAHNNNFTEDSRLTSWSTRRAVAEEFADLEGPGGVVLRTTVGAVRDQDLRILPSRDRAQESELLIEGPFEGAEVEYR
jgi:RHS repeat-associated protein